MRRKRPHVPVELRKRVSKACDICRKNKLKCDGQLVCKRCSSLQKPCQYSNVPRLSASACASPISLDSREEENGKDSGEFDVSSSDSTAFSENVELFTRLLPETSVTVHSQGKTHLDGGTSHWAFFESVQDTFEEHGEVETPISVENNKAYQHTIVNHSSFYNGQDRGARALAALPPRKVVDFLVATFFRFAQANFFYIHPEIFFRKLNNLYACNEEFGSREITSSTRSLEFISVLFMVLAIGSQFADVEDNEDAQHSSSSQESHQFNNAKLSEVVISSNPGWVFYEVARSLLPDVISGSSMTSVQACVLQGIFLFSTNARDVAYNMLGLAMRIAINMGMHRSISPSTLHPHVAELRNRLWWSLYTAERLFAVEMGRPLAIDDSEIDAPFPVDVPDLQTGDAPGNVDNQIALAQLCQIMGKIVRTVFPSSRSHMNGQVLCVASFKHIKSELSQWERKLPQSLKLVNNFSRSVAHIHLTYHQAMILLTRTSLNHMVAKDQHTMLSTATIEFIQHNAKDCLVSGQKSIEIMHSLKQRSLLCQFSFHDFLYCSTALYVLLLGGKLELQLRTTDSSVMKGISILSALAKGSEAAASALKVINRGLQACAKGKNSLNTGKEVSLPPQRSREEGRRLWQAWLTDKFSSESKAPRACNEEASQHQVNVDSTRTAHVEVSDTRSSLMSTHKVDPSKEMDDMSYLLFPRGVHGTPDESQAQSLWLPPLGHSLSHLGCDLSSMLTEDFLDHYDFSTLTDVDQLGDRSS